MSSGLDGIKSEIMKNYLTWAWSLTPVFLALRTLRDFHWCKFKGSLDSLVSSVQQTL